ncbi:Uncharacterised protein [Clostridium putrefaciens]|uniref:Uncharacterized protein n=1 Tax=Clostridium putrefaciens TaxID=99675 RepID=A0A381J4J9_9CLOT|nr:hypothetical protein [Clostridium putrefaciens]SUY45771.1 Uncharacterised protein [Clostridium putrefaciens]
MKETIKKVILHPYLKSWNRYLQDKEKVDIVERLKPFNLSEEKERRDIGFKITFSIFKTSKELDNPGDVTIKVLEILGEYEYLNEDIIKAFQSRLMLTTEVGLKDYHEMFNSNIINFSVERRANKYTNWFVELITYYYISKGNTSPNEIKMEIENIIIKSSNMANIKEQSIYDIQKQKGFLRKEIMDNISDIIMEHKDDIDELCKDIVSKSEKGSDLIHGEVMTQVVTPPVTPTSISTTRDVASDILNVFSSATNNKSEIAEVLPMKDKASKKDIKSEDVIKKDIKSEDVIKKDINSENIIEKDTKSENVMKNHIKIKNIIEKTKEVKSNEKSVLDDTINHLKALANSLGYNIVKKHELSKDDEGLEKDIKLLKSMADIENQFVLSELYNSYKNINTISKENLGANIESFFVNLALNQFEVNEDEYKVGQVVKVNTKDALKEYKFNNAVSKDGEIEGVVKYLSWSYKGIKVVPMIIEPK